MRMEGDLEGSVEVARRLRRQLWGHGHRTVGSAHGRVVKRVSARVCSDDTRKLPLDIGLGQLFHTESRFARTSSRYAATTRKPSSELRRFSRERRIGEPDDWAEDITLEHAAGGGCPGRGCRIDWPCSTSASRAPRSGMSFGSTPVRASMGMAAQYSRRRTGRAKALRNGAPGRRASRRPAGDALARASRSPACSSSTSRTRRRRRRST